MGGGPLGLLAAGRLAVHDRRRVRAKPDGVERAHRVLRAADEEKGVAAEDGLEHLPY